jgi:photosystem II stability/assembly factor-like uncharacterized protein
MNEATIRKRLRAALGESSYPADFSVRLAARLREPVHEVRHTWALATVAALIAIAVVITLVFSAHALRPKASVPAKPPPVVQVPGTATCPSYNQLPVPGGSDAPHPVTMSSATTGWAMGGLRTTDGGAHWRDVSPPKLREDSPTQFATTFYPPGYADFYLDANHAWEARSYSTATLCYDHIATFRTADGGRTWQQSDPIALNLKPGWGASAQLVFVDPRNGWLWVRRAAGEQDGMFFVPKNTEGALYGTDDGGLHWHLISNLVPSELGIPASNTCPSPLGGEVSFASPTNGWMTSCQTSPPSLLITRDGGATWKIQKLPMPASVGACPCRVNTLRFVDASDGVAQVFGDSGASVLLATSDGGSTWRALPPPGTGYLLLVDFADTNNLWALVTPPGWTKLSTAGYELYRSTDGGENWTLVRPDVPLSWPPGYLQFVDAEHGFASNINGASELLVTVDGGLSWKVIKPTVGSTK